MNHALASTLAAVAELGTERFQEGEPAAIALVGDHTMVGENYWVEKEEAHYFELTVVARAIEHDARHVAFAAPVYIRDAGGRMNYRPPAGPLGPDEREALWLLALDLDEGIDVGICPVGELPEMLTSPARLEPDTPGMTLVYALVDDANGG